MADPVVENAPLRHALGFGVLLAGIAVGTALGVAVPDSSPYAGVLRWAVIVPVALLTIEALHWVDGDVGLLGRWFGRDRRQ